MNEKHLFKIAICCSIIGLIAVIIASLYIEPQTAVISSLSGMNEGDYVKIAGNVTNVRQTPKAAFVDVADTTGAVTLVAFNDDAGFVKKEALPEGLQRGDSIAAEGKISIYNGKTEIVAELITKQ